eukprot:jgi/Psemu1/295692/fgenesh1_pm.82_\
MNENQNVFVRAGRTTSRVTNDPGGACQISIGGYTDAEMARMRQLREEREAAKKNAASGANTDAENKMKAVTNVKASAESEKGKDAAPMVDKTTEKPVASTNAPRISSNAFASSSTTNSFNVLTDRPTSRVTNPPGGHSSFTLG